jgi:uncharacterized protein HemX
VAGEEQTPSLVDNEAQTPAATVLPQLPNTGQASLSQAGVTGNQVPLSGLIVLLAVLASSLGGLIWQRAHNSKQIKR